MKKLIVFAIAIFGFTAVSFGQSSATANASATLIIPISIQKTADLAFGTIASSNTVGTAVVNAAGAISVTGGVKVVSGTTSAAGFTVTGQPGSAYTITTPATVILSDGAATPKLLTCTLTNSLGTTGLVAGGGTQTMVVSGSLAVPALTTAGLYQNTTDLTVTVNYN